MMEHFGAHEFLSLTADEKVTQTLMVPAMYNLFLLRCNVEDYDLQHWRIGGYGGSSDLRKVLAFSFRTPQKWCRYLQTHCVVRCG